MCSDVVIEMIGISKRYGLFRSPWHQLWHVLSRRRTAGEGDFYALRNVGFSLGRGETLGIIGRNGAGKSTLLQILCGVLPPTAGTVRVDGRIAALLELGAGFNPEFTGRENVYLSAAVYGLTQSQIRERLDSILAFAEIGEFVDRPVKTYSSGMFVRLAFAVIAHVDAQILVIDEALAVGDFAFTQKCMRFLEMFAATGTLVFVSHDTHSVVRLCSKAIWLENGCIRAFGPARDVSDAYLGSFYEDRLEEPAAGEDSGAGQEAFKKQFGLGGGRILKVSLLDDQGNTLQLLDRPQEVVVKVLFEAVQAIERPILGFYVKDRLGQPLFGDNTLGLLPDWQGVATGEQVEVCFTFTLPQLATGEYSLTVSLAEGTQLEHVQHHWIHDVLTFKALTNPHMTGLMQLQALRCEVTR